MTLATGIFRAIETELFAVLVGWLPPPARLAKPLERAGVDPFTKQPITILDWYGPRARAGPDAVQAPDLSRLPGHELRTAACDLQDLALLSPEDLLVRLGVRETEEQTWVDANGRELIGPKRAVWRVQRADRDLVTALTRLDEDKIWELARDAGGGNTWLRILASSARSAEREGRGLYFFESKLDLD